MTRSDMIETVMTAAIDALGVTTTDARYLAARRELEAHSESESGLLMRGVETGGIFNTAARVT